MFTIIFKKDSKVIQMARHDTSVNPMTSAEVLQCFCIDNLFSENDYGYAVMDKPVFNISCNHNHIYDEESNSVIVDVNYVDPAPEILDIPPAAVETSSIAVSDPAAQNNIAS
jgi:hypothetical protein